MGYAFICDKCDELFRGECQYPIYYGKDMIKKEYCKECWDKLNKSGFEVDIK